MDKNTLSNYGWIVIAVLVLSVMIALATPFGEYIKAGVESTTTGLFDTSEKALNVVGMSAKEETSKLVYQAESGNYTEGYYIGNGGKTENSAMAHTTLIEVKEGETYYFTHFYSYNGYPVVTLYDNEQNIVSAHNPPLSTLENSYCYVQDKVLFDNYERECNWVTIPQGIAYISFNVPKSQIINVNWGSFSVYESKPPFEFHSYTSALIENNNLTGKTALFYGDSIAAGQLSGNEGFPEYIASANNMKYCNNAVPGYKLEHIISQFNSSKNSFTQLTENDYVIVEGFINNVYTYPLPVGTLSAEGTTEFNESTFTGLLEKLVYDYQQAGYKGKLGFVLTTLPTRGSETQISMVRTYWDAAISVFEKYDVEYLDLYDKTYSYADGLHPDYQGAVELAKDVEVWMNSF